MTENTVIDLAARSADAADDVVADIVELVQCETHSYDKSGLDKGLDLLTAMAAVRLGEPDEAHRHPGGEHGDTATLTYHGSAPGHVALVGHYDTVWPAGTLGEWGSPQLAIDGDGRQRLSGPGVFDMKAGLVQGLWALRLLRESGLTVPTVTWLFNGDEEIGSPASRPLIEQVGAAADATLVLEPSVDGAVKTQRKGIGIFTVTATGLESHAGLDPEAGASAVHALAEFITAAAGAADPQAGTTINAGVVSGGTGTNVVAGRASAGFDIRVASAAERLRVDAAFDAIEVSDPRVAVSVEHGWNRPPMTLSPASKGLLDIARGVAGELGYALRDVAVGGASDANFVAAMDRPVLCGLGAVGSGAHARGEFVYTDTVPTQTALVAGLLHRAASSPASR
jgi:glutamate carboxypeptidase